MLTDVEEQPKEMEGTLLERPDCTSVTALARAVQQNPASLNNWLQFASAVAQTGRRRALVEHALGMALRVETIPQEALLDIGQMYQDLGSFEMACTCYERAIANYPEAVNPRIRLALLLERLNKLEMARDVLTGCHAARDEQVRYLIALLDNREGKLEACERELRDLIQSAPQHEYVRYACHYLLADVLDRTDRYDEAMKHLGEAKRHVADLADTNLLAQRFDEDTGMCGKRAKGLPRDILHIWNKYRPRTSLKCIPPFTFLGGHPRSGTTLLERVLGSHPIVAEIDEPLIIPRVLAAAELRGAEIGGAMPINFIRRYYIELLEQHCDGKMHERQLLEKNPSPTIMLPLLLRIFPELRVIIALRDPRDVVLSCYFQNIPLNQVNSNFLSFERIATHYSHLMDVWLAVREWDGFSWIETKYEDIVSDVAAEGSRVMDFMGLKWHANQARYFEQADRKPPTSPTYHDVRKPLYSRSVGRWRRYEKYLAPALPALEAYCKAFGYD
jgi:tetratricopeptide (TPR) repeat protein